MSRKILVLILCCVGTYSIASGKSIKGSRSGGVVSGGNLRIETVHITNDGVTCSADTDRLSSNWITSVTRAAAGECAIVFTNNVFSVAPVCTCNGDAATVMCDYTADPTTAGISIRLHDHLGNSFDGDSHLICMAPN
jgi:hypothetical protein